MPKLKKGLPTEPLAFQMLQGLSPFLSTNQRENARSLEGNNHVSKPLDMWSDSSGWFVRAKVKSQDPNRRTGAEKTPTATIFFGGNNWMKDRAQVLLEETEEFKELQAEVPGAALRLVHKLHLLYPLVPAPGQGWSDKVVPGCICQEYRRQLGCHRVAPPWCVHSAALMYRLAYTQEDDPLFLVKLNHFVSKKKRECIDLTATSEEEDASSACASPSPKRARHHTPLTQQAEK